MYQQVFLVILLENYISTHQAAQLTIFKNFESLVFSNKLNIVIILCTNDVMALHISSNN